MASKRDQLQAYQFMVQRVISAIVTRESDPEQPPFRRPTTTAFASIAVAFIALAAVGVYGLLVPGGNDAWRDGKSVIVVEETGSRYVYLDGRLHPVLNYSSALLALDSHAKTMSVSRNSLMDVPRGSLIGIPGAPEALPAAERVLRSGWTLCSSPARDDTGADVDESVLLVGHRPRGGRQLTDEALLLTVSGSGDQYLIWRGYRHLIREPDTVTVGLALRTEPHSRAGTELLDALPEGEAISPIKVTGIGKKSTAVPRRPDVKAGQLLVVETEAGGTQHYLADTEQLRPISPLQYDIQIAYQATAKAYRDAEPTGIPLGLLAASEAVVAPDQPRPTGAAPQGRPAFVDSGRGAPAVCATYDSGASVPQLSVAVDLPPAKRMTETAGNTEQGTPMADQVYVPPGWTAVVEAMPSSTAAAGALLVVTDQGRAYPLSERDDLDVLGYGAVRPVQLSASLIARIPLGRGLSTDAARAPARDTNPST
ncbi:MAG: type VII secretion protein EccB [Thermocrispum sp.]